MKIKNQKGVTLADVALSIFIVAIFVTINISLSYNSVLKAQSALRYEKATYYATKIAEYIQGLNYNDVNSYIDLTDFNIPSGYNCEVSVSSPSYQNIDNPQDLIKIVNIYVSYNVGSQNNQFELRTLKVNKE